MRRARLHLLLHDLWSVALTVLLVLLGLETLERGFVARFFDMNLLVLFLFGLSVILLMTRPKRAETGDVQAAALQAVGVAAAAAVWSFFPEDASLASRAFASGGTLLLALLAWPIIRDR